MFQSNKISADGITSSETIDKSRERQAEEKTAEGEEETEGEVPVFQW
jgi:hypothetical protein